ncbi:MAG: antitoxin family protein [Gemmataceae bacterium]|nr:antitoxin family protein [Gemmataceae bacterium]
MHQTVEAIYEDGVLRPLEELSLRPRQRVFLQIKEAPDAAEDLEDEAFVNYCRAQGDPNIALDQVRQALAAIPGSLTEACSAERDED